MSGRPNIHAEVVSVRHGCESRLPKAPGVESGLPKARKPEVVARDDTDESSGEQAASAITNKYGVVVLVVEF
jgi:hypothetical protein